MADCCPVAPYQPSIWDPHRQAEPVRLWWASSWTEQVSFVFLARAGEAKAIAAARGAETYQRLEKGLETPQV